jgi:hypothetical protein
MNIKIFLIVFFLLAGYDSVWSINTNRDTIVEQKIEDQLAVKHPELVGIFHEATLALSLIHISEPTRPY